MSYLIRTAVQKTDIYLKIKENKRENIYIKNIPTIYMLKVCKLKF